MEGRKSSKKPRSYGGALRSSRTSPNSPPSPSSAPRPQYKERVRSAPLGVPQLEERQQQETAQQLCPDKVKRDSRTSEPVPRPLGPIFTPVSNESCVHSQPCGTNGYTGDVQEVILAVLGAPAVGKSTFVRCALDLKSVSPVPCKKVSLEGKISIVRLLELGFEDLEITTDMHVRWPTKVGDYDTPIIDGVLALYDVKDQGSMARIPALLRMGVGQDVTAKIGSDLHCPPILEALSNHGIPTVLVSAKSDSPRGVLEVDYDMVDQLCTTVTGIESFPVSLFAPETHKRCISIILRNIMVKRREEFPLSKRPTRPRALTATHHTFTGEGIHPLGPAGAKSKHGRAVSEVPNLVTRNIVPIATLSALPRPTAADDSQGTYLETSTTALSRDLGEVPDGSDDVLVSYSKGTEDPVSGNKPLNELSVSIRDKAGGTSTTVSDPVQGSSDTQRSGVADVGVLNPPNSKFAEIEDDDAKESGVAFEDLVDRLLAQPVSKSDCKFASIFLCLYRKFAPPFSLIEAIIRRFEDLNGRDLPHLTRITSQLRYLNILKDWASNYPGDFAHPLTRRVMTVFVQGLAASSDYATANNEISPYFDVVMEDDDMNWACSDKSRSRANTTESFLTVSSVQSAATTLNADSPTLTADSSTEDVVEHEGLEKVQLTRSSEQSSLVPSIGRSEAQSTGSVQTLLNTLEHAQCQAQLLTPTPRYLLTKVQWHQFMDITEEDVARELTRIDWIMYCSIRPRDLVRHVSLANDQKDKCKSLENFNRMIHHFNHVAFWVANLILLRDKPKHRARALEKFMSIAWKLRYLNNYNSLGAVISGINSIAVHRLAQTRELIPAPAQKQFMRLEILMGSQKSHSAYRLAWTNTPTQRIPFLPLHLRDLVLAEQGNRTYVAGAESERINWKKFEVMGEVIIGIRKSQEVQYPMMARNEEVQRLILDGRFCEDEDELYERSINLEGQNSGENTRKRFNWFQR